MKKFLIVLAVVWLAGCQSPQQPQIQQPQPTATESQLEYLRLDREIQGLRAENELLGIQLRSLAAPALKTAPAPPSPPTPPAPLPEKPLAVPIPGGQAGTKAMVPSDPVPEAASPEPAAAPAVSPAAPTAAPPPVEAAVVKPRPPKPTGFWLTESTGKRHNAKCRYFEKTAGRPCSPTDGTPCKLCGG